MQIRKKTGILLGVVILTSFSIFYATFYWDNTSFQEAKYEIYIESDWDFEVLKNTLSPHLRSARLFGWAAELKGYDIRIRGGKYTLVQGLSNNEIINKLRLQSEPVQVTFNNQERIENLAGRLAEVLESDSLSFLKAMKSASFLDQKGFSLDTALAMYLPNTYQVFWNISPEAFCERMHQEFEKFWSAERKALAKQQGLSPVEVITLASIVHKETIKAVERPLIAGVYLNRLKQRMRLQADPTVIYALKQKFQNFDTIIKRVLYKDLRIRSPYNTYRVKKLPLGPIAMPDISAIEAVLRPEKHSYLYFVANPEKPGYHRFASSLAQHNRNKRKYTRWLNQNKLYR